MQTIKSAIVCFAASAVLLFACSRQNPDNLKLVTKTTGVIGTNCYLLYDDATKDAALIDPGDTVFTLLSHIEKEKLNLRYILITHCHPDHIYGFITMQLREKFPDAKICYSAEEYEDMTKVVSKWKEVYPDEVSQQIQNSPVFLKLFSMDYNTLGRADIFLNDNQKLPLGNFEITAIKSPGHAPGSVCYHINNFLFSGDELMFRRVGGTKTSPVASFDAQVKSIRKLYNEFPDETIVYPGHGQSTTIGEEKTQNKNITLTTAAQ